MSFISILGGVNVALENKGVLCELVTLTSSILWVDLGHKLL